MSTQRKEVIGNATLYHGDCLEILPTLGKVDAVITDPPYGIGEAAGKNKSRGKLAVSKDYGDDSWDEATADVAVAMALQKARWAIVFGGNYYNLPPSSCWLVWDKMNGSTDFADCELAWTNLKKAVRRIQLLWNGCMRVERDIERVHPTQKPVALMEWCISHLPSNTEAILDPFAGSGTTGVAALRMGKSFIGIEREKKYFDAMCARITEATENPSRSLFPPSCDTVGTGKSDSQVDLLLEPTQTSDRA